MKHENESIDRLDGDFYEAMNGHVIYLHHIVAVGRLSYYIEYFGYEILTHTGKIQIECETVESSAAYKSDSYGKLEAIAEKHRQQFIEVWKHWKSKQ